MPCLYPTMKNTVILLDFLVRPKLCVNCAFPQNFHNRKLGEITVFFAVFDSSNSFIIKVKDVLQEIIKNFLKFSQRRKIL